ncbi:3-keto-disaccharide hydrolase [Parapedobacter indicus]|uniref:3-keto-alpha-glucoside-1,2-lyase/3-keto-2-hydroxy-glucal hydratase domain-containing protein n=1 Tax=Parapedobacter indicus TaxID=1477437 RepID=A0A1I3DLN0_9SPHI|nr:DUF1080 domain-containing protein [Parapedobacter indicus]PPL04746.1 uncharacterized protein DUF1080 [Parapedobacter indicus]SFH87637.1 protein of unknown function [Parapedobacter indicus]
MNKINYITGMALIVLSLSACTQQANQTADNQTADQPETPCAEEAVPEGGEWLTLFDGQTLAGWRGYCMDSIPAGWVVDDGNITFKGSESTVNPEGGDLIYDRAFKNFILEIDWKIDKAGNSGIFYTAQEVKGKPIYYSSPEYQLLDNENMPDAWQGVGGNRQAGAVYDMIPPVPQPVKPYGNWNHTKIVLYKQHVYHYMNDTLVLDFKLGTPVWKALVDKSKFSKFSNDPEKCPDAYELMLDCGKNPGYIGLQDHGYGVRFRNIRIKDLDQ